MLLNIPLPFIASVFLLDNLIIFSQQVFLCLHYFQMLQSLICINLYVIQVADNYYRPDLKKASLARLSAVNKSLKIAKSGVKKRNRQA